MGGGSADEGWRDEDVDFVDQIGVSESSKNCTAALDQNVGESPAAKLDEQVRQADRQHLAARRFERLPLRRTNLGAGDQRGNVTSRAHELTGGGNFTLAA